MFSDECKLDFQGLVHKDVLSESCAGVRVVWWKLIFCASGPTRPKQHQGPQTHGAKRAPGSNDNVKFTEIIISSLICKLSILSLLWQLFKISRDDKKFSQKFPCLECAWIHVKPPTFTFSKSQVPKQDYFVCDKIEYLFSNFRFLLSWRNLSGSFTVFWNNRQLIGSCLNSLGICFWEGYHHYCPRTDRMWR